MKNKKLMLKYYYIMSFSIFLIPVTFIILNYIFLISYTVIAYIIKENRPFSSSFIYANFYVFYFLLLLTMVWVGSKYFKTVVIRINKIKDTVESITNDDVYPRKLDFLSESDDEINRLSGAINKLIDRLRYKESLLEQQKKLKQENLKQLSHDINTPLTAMMLELYELSSEYQIPEYEISQLYNKIIYTNQLVKKLSENEEDDFRNQYIFMEEYRVDLVVKKSLKKWKYLIDKNDINLKSKINSIVIWTTEELLFERLLDNIISNIVRHSKTKEIFIVLSDDKLIIRDFGVGYDVNQETTKNKGINIINDICKKLNLIIDINSNVTGTEYKITYYK
ncbi:hypothetical protein ACMGE6_04440 [Macrococcus equi]|uniref:hypothetical protein n=1 Tax=Macrococcus equi TaxID=3395462 RepID=UPI0039BDF94D